MTISSTINRWPYVGDGVTKSFPYTNRIFDAGDIEVYIAGAPVASGFVVTGVGDSNGGTVDMDAAPADELDVLLVRNVPATQETDYRENDPFPAETHEKVADKAVVLVQQLVDALSRTIRLAAAAPAAALELPGVVAGRALKWNADASALVNSDTDPDTTVALAAAAAGDAAIALSRADEALAAAVQIGLANLETLSTTLAENEQDYELPVAVVEAKNLLVTIGGQILQPSVDYTLGTEHGPGKTLHLEQNVAADPSGLEWPVGLPLFVLVIATGLTTNSLHPKSVTEPKLADGAASARVVADGSVGEPKLAAGAVSLGKVKSEGSEGDILFRDAGGVLSHLPAGDANTVLAGFGAGQKPAYQSVRSWVFLEAQKPTIDKDYIDFRSGDFWTSYDTFLFEVRALRPGNSGQGLAARIWDGSDWRALASDYCWGYHELRWPSNDLQAYDMSDHRMLLTQTSGWGNVLRSRMYGEIYLHQETGRFTLRGDLTYGDTASSSFGKRHSHSVGWARDLEGVTVQGLRLFLVQPGNFTSDGVVLLYGHKAG